MPHHILLLALIAVLFGQCVQTSDPGVGLDGVGMGVLSDGATSASLEYLAITLTGFKDVARGAFIKVGGSVSRSLPFTSPDTFKCTSGDGVLATDANNSLIIQECGRSTTLSTILADLSAMSARANAARKLYNSLSAVVNIPSLPYPSEITIDQSDRGIVFSDGRYSFNLADFYNSIAEIDWFLTQADALYTNAAYYENIFNTTTVLANTTVSATSSATNSNPAAVFDGSTTCSASSGWESNQSSATPITLTIELSSHEVLLTSYTINSGCVDAVSKTLPFAPRSFMLLNGNGTAIDASGTIGQDGVWGARKIISPTGNTYTSTLTLVFPAGTTVRINEISFAGFVRRRRNAPPSAPPPV